MEIQQSTALSEIDLSDPELWSAPQAVREAVFATLRAERPVPFFAERAFPGVDLPVGPGYWNLTKHADILEASRKPHLFCSSKGATAIPDLPEDFNEFFGGMINMDDPRHARQRKIISRGFTPRALSRIEASVQERARRVVDRVIEKGECDFVADIAAPLPLEIICDMMGIPEVHAPMVLEKTNLILGLGDPDFVAPGGDLIGAALVAGAELAALMQEMAEERRKRPTEDLTSALIDASGDDGALTDQELCSFFILLVAAGNETTRNSISHGMKALCDYPDQRAIWAADFEGILPKAVEEIVRWASPVMFMRRTCTEDLSIGGQAMKAGDKVLLWYTSGNRDEDVFDQPYKFDVRRSPNEHVGFGGPGPHFCLGANLARREIGVMFREIFNRLPDLTITGEPAYLRSNFINGVKRMPCAFTPGKAGA